MNKAQRKRRAAVGAMALLEWRGRMERENAARANAEREMMQQFGRMIAAMARQAEAFEVEFADRGPAPRVWSTFSVMPACHGTGHAGAL